MAQWYTALTPTKSPALTTEYLKFPYNHRDGGTVIHSPYTYQNTNAYHWVPNIPLQCFIWNAEMFNNQSSLMALISWTTILKSGTPSQFSYILVISDTLSKYLKSIDSRFSPFQICKCRWLVDLRSQSIFYSGFHQLKTASQTDQLKTALTIWSTENFLLIWETDW